MTQEEKARAYDEVREKIALRFGSNVAEEIFSMFEESEDERIRKAIIEFFELQDDNTTYSFIPKKDILAWLEKQGINYSLVEEIKKRKDSFMREKEKAVSSNDKLSLGARIAMLEELLVFVKEKQGEQKPADKPISKDEILYQLVQNGTITEFDYLYLTGRFNMTKPTKDYQDIDPHFGIPVDKVKSNLLTVERAKEISPFMRSGFENESADKVETKFKKE